MSNLISFPNDKMMSKFVLILLLAEIICCAGADKYEVPEHDRFKLSLVWPNSECLTNNDLQCRYPIPQYFVAKSFWAENSTLQPITNCTTNLELTDDTISLHKYGLLKYWPDLSTDDFESSKKFWKDQWNTYGSCFTDNMLPEAYIITALKLIRQVKNMHQMLKGSGIVANGSSYGTDKIFSAIKKATRLKVDIVCEADDIDDSVTFFSEIHLCVDNEGKKFVDCDRMTYNCERDPIFPDSV